MARHFRLALLALVAVAGMGSTVVAQEDRPQAEFGTTVDVNEVLLDVLVTDAKGNVIIGLGENDFKVTENGKPVDLTGVTFYSNRRFLESSEAARQKGIDAKAAPENRYFVLFFDDQRSTTIDAPGLFAKQLEAGRRAEAWVRTLLPSDYVAVASWDHKLKVQQDFSRDRRDLTAAIKAAMSGKDPENQWPSRTGDAAAGPSLLAALPKGNALRDQTTTIYDALRVLADASGGITGRKNLLLFTIGFGRINDFGQYNPDPRYYPPMMRALNDNNVAVYTLDLSPPGSRHILADAMNQLADETGGRYYFNFTSFETPLKQITEENSGYYLLSYKAEHPAGKSGFQEVQVRTTNPEFKVRTRDGYAYGS